MQILLLVSFLTGSAGIADERFPNELNSPIDEPLVVLPENPQKVPIRPASAAVLATSDPLVKLAYETREVQRQRLLSTSEHTPWQMMHGLLGLRQDFLISHNGQTINGLEWIQTGPMFRNEPWFEKTQFGGRAHPYTKPYWFEGHINQSLAILATCNIPLDTQFGTPNGPITMREMLRNAQMTTNEKEEVTWTLWALCTYLPSDAEWVNARGERWSIERLVQIEVGKQVGGPTSPCGGTHGLFALARARNVYLRTGKPLRGVWLQADQKIQKYIQTARNLQNSNGTLSSNFFRGREYKQDFDKRMASSGHVLEFLMMALPQERLKEQWVRRAVEATANDLMANRKAYVSCSPLYHATNALTIYLERVLPPGQPAVAQNPVNTTTISSATEKKAPETPAAQTAPSNAMNSAAAADARTAQSGTPAGAAVKTPGIAASGTQSGTAPAASAAVLNSATPGKTDIMIPMPEAVSSNDSGGPLIQIPLPDEDAATVEAKETSSTPPSTDSTSSGTPVPSEAATPQSVSPTPTTTSSIPANTETTTPAVPALSPVPVGDESGPVSQPAAPQPAAPQPAAPQPAAPQPAAPQPAAPQPAAPQPAAPGSVTPEPLVIPGTVPVPDTAVEPKPLPIPVSTLSEESAPAVVASPSASAVSSPSLPAEGGTPLLTTRTPQAPPLAAEQYQDRAISSPPVPVVVSPVPLQKTPAILFVPGAAKTAPLTRPILQSSSPTTVLPAKPTIEKLSLPLSEDIAVQGASTGDEATPVKTPSVPEGAPQKRSGWKSTPLQRRTQIVFDEPLRI